MKAAIIKIGNSKGIRIPKAFLEESGLGGRVELRLKGNSIVISPERPAPSPSAHPVNEEALLSEATFSKEWLRPEEDTAWAVYQLGK